MQSSKGSPSWAKISLRMNRHALLGLCGIAGLHFLQMSSYIVQLNPPNKICSDSTLGSDSSFGHPIAFSGGRFFLKLDYINRCLCSIINDAATAKLYKA